MKKSKILGLSLGAVALTTVAVATPVILTSCGDSVITDIEVGPNAIKLTTRPGANTSNVTLNREKGTNYFNLDVKGPKWTGDDVLKAEPSAIATNWVSKERLIKEGFDKDILTALEGSQDVKRNQSARTIMVIIGTCDKNGKIVYPTLDKIDENAFTGYNQTKSTLIYNTVKIVQVDLTGLGGSNTVIPSNKIEKEITIDFKLTINPNK